jgi:endonuclease/exonuclease/phosphatase family metal-dependent hydrolase
MPFAITVARNALAGAAALAAVLSPGAVQAGSAQAASAEVTFDVLTYNVLMLPVLPRGQDRRAPLIARRLAGYDAIVLQEAYSDRHRAALLAGLAAEYPHRTRILGADLWLRQDGGVIVLSRWPIARQRQLRFGDLCAGRDCLADKGALYARITKLGQSVNLFATHLQSGQTQSAIRERQLELIKAMIDALAIGPDEPVLIAGDLNVDRLADARTGEFAAMTRILSAAHPAPPKGRAIEPTFDPARNPLAGGSRRECLDYVLYSEAHLRPLAAFNAVRRLTADGRPLSDHFAVHGRFVFPLPPRPLAERPDPAGPAG